jgi:phytoene desaturase
MFIGVSPFQAPAFYSIISYADQVQKIFHPMGGMYQVPKALETMARNFGTRFHYNQEIKQIKNSDGKIVLKSADAEMDFGQVAVNADYCYAQSQLLNRKIPGYKYSCSVFLIYLGLKKKIHGLAHHNLFFSSGLKKNLQEIFQDQTTPLDPSFYVHLPTVTDSSLAPAGKEICYILIPVANLERPGDNFSAQEDRLRKLVFAKIKQVTGEDLENLIEVEHRFYPKDFISRYNIKYGATFGLAHNLTQSAFFRPTNFDPWIKNLYFVGASTQPGGGLPVVIASSRITADLITR